MDWARAVEINRKALSLIVAELFAMLGLVSGGTVERLPSALYAAVERILRPTESAVRRLIVIAARGLVVKPLPKRALPEGLVLQGKGAKKITFQLFDSRVSFDFIRPENPFIVTVQTYQANPFNLFNGLNGLPIENSSGEMSAINMCRRLAAIAQALKTLPDQARRLVRWKERRKSLEKPKFTSPLRPGPPPGYRRKSTQQIDFVLKECHSLAWDCLRQDSS
jgi:hypothetical protein